MRVGNKWWESNWRLDNRFIIHIIIMMIIHILHKVYQRYGTKPNEIDITRKIMLV